MYVETDFLWNPGFHQLDKMCTMCSNLSKLGKTNFSNHTPGLVLKLFVYKFSVIYQASEQVISNCESFQFHTQGEDKSHVTESY